MVRFWAVVTRCYHTSKLYREYFSAQPAFNFLQSKKVAASDDPTVSSSFGTVTMASLIEGWPSRSRLQFDALLFVRMKSFAAIGSGVPTGQARCYLF